MFSIDLGGLADSMFDLSGNQQRADEQIRNQERWNQRTYELDSDKFGYAKLQDRTNREREDTRLQRLVKDANAAGVSISSALGASPSSPASISIPGHSSQRVAGNTWQRNLSGKVMMDIQRQSENAKSRDYNSALQTQFDAQMSYWKAKQAELEYNRETDGSPYPKKYQFYIDNTSEAQEWIRNGGFVIPSGASMELPESVGAYHFGKPYVKEEMTLKGKNPNRYEIGIMP